jgi:DNA-binding transcriptional ArsR family regulator
MPTAVASAPELSTASARFFRVLGHPTRLQILALLLERPHTVSELVEVLGSSQSRVSNHLACLRWCGFVETERHGRQITYRLGDPRVGDVVAAAEELASDHCELLASCTRIGPDWI